MKKLLIGTKTQANKARLNSLFQPIEGRTLTEERFDMGHYRMDKSFIGREIEVSDNVYALWTETRKDSDGPYRALYCMSIRVTKEKNMKTKLGEGSTPGPWKVTRQSENQSDIVVVGDGLRSVIARTHSAWLCPEHGGLEHGNSLLVAKAPLLIEARDVLEKLLHETDGGSQPCGKQFVDKARALLAKLNDESEAD